MLIISIIFPNLERENVEPTYMPDFIVACKTAGGIAAVVFKAI